MNHSSPSFHRRALLATLGLLGLALPPAAQAQNWPAKPLTVVVPFPAGGGTDAFARPLFAQLTKQLGMQVVIDNKGGAGGNVGATIASKAAGDGYTWFMGGVHHAIAPSIYPKLDYNLSNDFTPVALLASVPQVIIVNPQKVKANNLQEFLSYAKAHPGKINFGSAGNGTSHHLAGELFNLQAMTTLVHVPYRGAGPALQDVIAGQIEMMFDGLGSSASHIKGGKVKALAVAGEQRANGFPDIPTASEAGMAGYHVATWYGLWAPKGTPQAAIDRMAAELQKAFASNEIKDAWKGLGAYTPNLYGQPFADFVSSETRRWAEVVKAANVKLD